MFKRLFVPISRAERAAVIGLLLALLIASSWIAIHVIGIFLLPRSWFPVFGPVMIVLECWLSVGLFILAHDAMHGTLAPGHGRINRAVGRVVLLMYAGIWYDRLVGPHHAHHDAPGTKDDPDFHGDGTANAWRWYRSFFLNYLTLGQVLRIAAACAVYVVVLGAAPWRIAVFWALPGLLSSFQLFYFGTYLPHRAGLGLIDDRHRARSSGFGPMVSLLTCFHFGYHHEHHDRPAAAWWQLPGVRRRSSARVA